MDNASCVYRVSDSSIKMGTTRIICQEELSFEVCRSRYITKDSFSGWIMHLVCVFILEMHNQINYKCWSKFVQMDNASSSIKTTIYSGTPPYSYLVNMITLLLWPIFFVLAKCPYIFS